MKDQITKNGKRKQKNGLPNMALTFKRENKGKISHFGLTCYGKLVERKEKRREEKKITEEEKRRTRTRREEKKKKSRYETC